MKGQEMDVLPVLKMTQTLKNPVSQHQRVELLVRRIVSVQERRMGVRCVLRGNVVRLVKICVAVMGWTSQDQMVLRHSSQETM